MCSFDGRYVLGWKVVVPRPGKNKTFVPMVWDKTWINVSRLGNVNVWCVHFSIQRELHKLLTVAIALSFGFVEERFFRHVKFIENAIHLVGLALLCVNEAFSGSVDAALVKRQPIARHFHNANCACGRHPFGKPQRMKIRTVSKVEDVWQKKV